MPLTFDGEHPQDKLHEQLSGLLQVPGVPDLEPERGDMGIHPNGPETGVKGVQNSQGLGFKVAIEDQEGHRLMGCQKPSRGQDPTEEQLR